MDRIKLASIILISMLSGAVFVLIGFSFVAGNFFDTSSVSIVSASKSQKNADSGAKDNKNLHTMLKYQNKEYGFEFEFPDTYLITENELPGLPVEFPVSYTGAHSFEITPSIVRLDVLEDINTLTTSTKDEIKASYGSPVYFFRIKEESASELFERLTVEKESFFERNRLDAIKCREDFSDQLDESELSDKCSEQVFGGANYSTTTIAGVEAIDVGIGDGGGSRSFFLLPSKGMAIGPFDNYYADNPWRQKNHNELIDSLKHSFVFIDR